MKNPLIKKTFIGALALAIALPATAATNPVAQIVTPEETRAILQDIASAGRARELARLITPEVTQVILDYSKIKNDDFNGPHSPVAATPAALGAAAAAGATAAVVEHYWDKYVGNSRSQIPRINEINFDLPPAPVYPSRGELRASDATVHQLVWVGPAGGMTKAAMIRAQHEKIRNLVPRGEQAHVTLVVAEAAVGAAAYKAAEWAMNKWGGRSTLDRSLVNEAQFDISSSIAK